jgi:hypothetical protein
MAAEHRVARARRVAGHVLGTVGDVRVDGVLRDRLLLARAAARDEQADREDERPPYWRSSRMRAFLPTRPRR